MVRLAKAKYGAINDRLKQCGRGGACATMRLDALAVGSPTEAESADPGVQGCCMEQASVTFGNNVSFQSRMVISAKNLG